MRCWIIGLTVFVATPAVAQTPDRNATAAIAVGDYAKAERLLVAERRIFPQRPELMLNLAAVYNRTGRAADAQALYADVLRRPAVMMDLPDRRIVSSHALAEAGLRRTSQMAAR